MLDTMNMTDIGNTQYALRGFVMTEFIGLDPTRYSYNLIKTENMLKQKHQEISRSIYGCS